MSQTEYEFCYLVHWFCNQNKISTSQYKDVKLYEYIWGIAKLFVYNTHSTLTLENEIPEKMF